MSGGGALLNICFESNHKISSRKGAGGVVDEHKSYLRKHLEDRQVNEMQTDDFSSGDVSGKRARGLGARFIGLVEGERKVERKGE